MNLLVILLALLSALIITNAQADTSNIAVAANFSRPMKDIVEAFEQSTPHKINLVFGSSGKLFAQIQNGAPFDAFFSADTSKPDALIKSNLAISESRFTYAVGSLILWQPKGTDDPLTNLKRGQFKKLAIANPRLAPYGKAAMETLTHLGLADSTTKHIVTGENIAQTYQFVSSGNAQLGLIALSQVNTKTDTESKAGTGPAFWKVPKSMHQPIRQDAVLIQHAVSNPATNALMSFMHSKAATAIILRYGYRINE